MGANKIVLAVISFAIGIGSTIGVAVINGVPVCSIVNTCENDLVTQNNQLIHDIKQRNVRIAQLEKEVKNSADAIKGINNKIQDRNTKINVIIGELKTVNLTGVSNAKKIRILADKITSASAAIGDVIKPD